MEKGYKECPECVGEGFSHNDDGEWIICPTCKGWGKVLEDNS